MAVTGAASWPCRHTVRLTCIVCLSPVIEKKNEIEERKKMFMTCIVRQSEVCLSSENDALQIWFFTLNTNTKETY